jgi:hypothetical protein
MNKNHPEHRFCEASSGKCQNTNCLKQNVCQQSINSSRKLNKDSVAIADRYNLYIGWPKAGTQFEAVVKQDNINKIIPIKQPDHRFCEGSPGKCQNSNCLKSNKCGLLLAAPLSTTITASSIETADSYNKKIGWPQAGTSI